MDREKAKVLALDLFRIAEGMPGEDRLDSDVRSIAQH
jgi:hypothetical protein